MIKKLRIRFIIIAIASVFLVLSIITTFTNFFNFTKVRIDADDMLYLIEDYDGKLEEYLKELEEIERLEQERLEKEKESQSEKESSSSGGSSSNENSEESSSDSESSIENESSSALPEQERPKPDFFSKETPYETRFFIVKFGKEVTTNLEHIASVSEEDAISLAKEALKSEKTTAYQGSYRFLVSNDGENTSVIFLDCNRQVESAKSFLLRSILVALGALLCVFCILLPLSARVVQPIAEGYERQKRFITDAGHELKTPLTIISASNELLELTTGENENTRAISRQVARMSSMVKNLSALASLDESSRLSQESEISLSSILSELCKLFENVLTRGERSFEKDIADDVHIIGDEALVRHLFSILFENAGKYAISTTAVSLQKVGKRAVVTISNDAHNVQNGPLNRCFERFYRSDEARASGTEGSGIGLCLAKEIADLHGFEISANGQDGIFTIKVIF